MKYITRDSVHKTRDQAVPFKVREKKDKKPGENKALKQQRMFFQRLRSLSEKQFLRQVLTLSQRKSYYSIPFFLYSASTFFSTSIPSAGI